ncbi:MAG: hypothetical protein ACRC92_14755 [Peptostreptococcaceae bacterium]
MEYIEKLIEQDPLFIIIPIAILMVLLFVYARGLFDKLVLLVVSESFKEGDTDISKEEMIEVGINSLVEKVYNAFRNSKKRRTLVSVIIFFLKTKFVKRYILKLIEKNEQDERLTANQDVTGGNKDLPNERDDE